MISIPINIIQHDQLILFFFTPHHAWVPSLIIGLTIKAMAVTAVTGWCWRLLIYALCNILLCNNVMSFQKQPPSLKVSQIPQENTCVECLFFLEMMKLYKDICSASIKVDLHWVSCANDFFNLHLRWMECSVYLTSLLFLLTKSHCLKYWLINSHWPL